MSRRYKKRRFHFGVFLFFLTVVVIAGVFFIPWVMKPENFRSEKNAIYSFLYGEFQPDSYNAKSLILVDRSNNDFFISKKENEQHWLLLITLQQSQTWTVLFPPAMKQFH